MLKKILFFLALSMLLSCKGVKRIEHPGFSQSILYSGIVQLCPLESTQKLVLHKVINAEMYYLNNKWFIYPTHTGESTIYYSVGTTKAIHSLSFQVVQFPQPLFWIGPVSPHHYSIFSNPNYWFVQAIDKGNLLKIKKEIIEYTETDFEVKSFSFSLFAPNDSLILQRNNSDFIFSEENKAIIFKEQREGCKLLVDHIEFINPDGSTGFGTVDTLYFVADYGFLPKSEIPKK
jgi:hypothetical protein